MGACFTLVFEGCPLTINSTASWINPANNGKSQTNVATRQTICQNCEYFTFFTKGQILLFGSTEGIYFLSLRDLADRSLELVSLICPSSPLTL